MLILRPKSGVFTQFLVKKKEICFVKIVCGPRRPHKNETKILNS